MSKENAVLYDPKSFVCLKPENFTKYFEEYTKLITENLNVLKNSADGSKEKESKINNLGVDLDEDKLKELENICNPENLKFDEEIKPIPHKFFYQPTALNMEIPSGADHLKVIETKKKWANKFGKVFPYQNRRIGKTNILDQNLIPHSDIVFTVKDYHPFKYTQEAGFVKKDRVKCNFEIAILGAQTLADLRDKMKCPNDMGYSVELESPTETITNEVKNQYPSGFFFIENCFYNDMRKKNAIDYSEPIREWGKRKNMKNWTTGSMEKTKIQDLTINLGYPYVYQHQGDCEHIIIFADVRLLRETDPLDAEDYPYFQYMSRFTSNLCYMCGHDVTKYVVVDGDRLPHKLTYMCEECLTSYNYINGEKVGDFKLYPYFDRSSLVLE